MSVRRLAEKQPPSFAFTPENLSWAKAQIAKYPEGRQASAVIPILWRVQEQHGGTGGRVRVAALVDGDLQPVAQVDRPRVSRDCIHERRFPS